MLQLTQTSTPLPPHHPMRSIRNLATLIVLMCLMLALSGCSTPPAVGTPWNPPASALIKAEPLPQFEVDPNAASNAPSKVDKAALVDSDLEVVKLYHRLAKRHNALVDAVMEKLKQQAK